MVPISLSNIPPAKWEQQNNLHEARPVNLSTVWMKKNKSLLYWPVIGLQSKTTAATGNYYFITGLPDDGGVITLWTFSLGNIFFGHITNQLRWLSRTTQRHRRCFLPSPTCCTAQFFIICIYVWWIWSIRPEQHIQWRVKKKEKKCCIQQMINQIPADVCITALKQIKLQ